MTSEPMNDSVHGHHHGWCDKCLVEGVHRAATPAPRGNGWDELRRLAEKATPGPWRHGWDDGSGRAEATEGGSITLPGETVIEGQEVVAGGRDSWGIAVGVRKAADADYIAAVSPDVVLRLLAAARGEPGLDVELLARALTAMWPHHTEGVGSSPPSPGDHSYEVWEPFLPGSPASVAVAIAAEYNRLTTPTTPEPDPELAKAFDDVRAVRAALPDAMDAVMRQVTIGTWYDDPGGGGGGPAVARLHDAESAMWKLYDLIGLDPGDAYTRRATPEPDQ